MKISSDFGPIHFVGIGGIGMSGIAALLFEMGYDVTGSDINVSSNTERLQKKGIKVSIPHAANNIIRAKVVVISSAISEDNIEIKAARINGIPIIRRSEMLAELMRFKSTIAVGGSHGKTTTTSIINAILHKGGLDPTVINGGLILNFGTNAKLGNGNWMVVEADESDGTFIRLPSDVVVVTNIDPEHIDNFGSEKKLVEAFSIFIENIPFYGFAVVNIDHPTVREVVAGVRNRRIITYGMDEKANYKLHNLRFLGDGAQFDCVVSYKENIILRDLYLPMPGKYNSMNAMAAIAVACELDVTHGQIRKALADFHGVARRYTKIGEKNGVTVYDDYGHHPVEIKSVIEAARSSFKGKIFVVMQPHRFSRLESLFDDFTQCMLYADQIMITPVYSAGEKVGNKTSYDLVQAIYKEGFSNVCLVHSVFEIQEKIKQNLRPGDKVFFLGAGDIFKWSAEFLVNIK